ncbi:MAG: hypothetical protein IJY94_02925 [Clostridia bacterium]|nr:hypothetical protein [Clostridia bacterium]
MAKRNRNINYGPILLSFTAIFAVIGMIFETLAILFGYDANMRVFKLGSKVATASVAALFILSIATITLAICVGKLGKMKTRVPNSGLADVISTVGGFALAASSVLLLAESWGSKIDEAGALRAFTVILVIVSIPTALYFVLGTERRDRLSTFLSFFPPLWNAACLIRLYFDSETAVNDPVRILLQITLVAVMLALMYELKLKVRGTGHIMLTVTAPVATVLSCASFTSIILLYLIVKVGSVANVLLSAGTLLLSLYLMTRLGAYYELPKDRD